MKSCKNCNEYYCGGQGSNNISNTCGNGKFEPMIEIDDDFETVLICALRYACGRETYMPKLVIDYVTPLLPVLSMRALTVMRNDLNGTTFFGDEQIDKPEWLRFLQKVENEIDKRKE